MAMVEKYRADVQVFRWNVNLPVNSHIPSESSYAGLLLLRSATEILSPSVDLDRGYFQEGAVIPLFKLQALSLNSFMATKAFLVESLEQMPFLGSCQNFTKVVYLITQELHCRFRFSSEILSGSGAYKPVIFIDLKVVLGREAWESIPIMYAVTNFTRDHDLDELTLGDDVLTGEQIEDVLKRHPLINAEEPKGMHEVEPRTKFRDPHQDVHDLYDDDSSVKVCSICLEELPVFSVLVKAPCSHIFHRRCIFRWLINTNSCPTCRSPCMVCV